MTPCKTILLAIGLIAATGSVAVAMAGSNTAQERDRAAKPKYCPLDDSSGFDARELRGRQLPFARRGAHRHDCSLRVVKRDGENLAVTADFSPSRINVAVADGRVIRIAGVF